MRFTLITFLVFLIIESCAQSADPQLPDRSDMYSMKEVSVNYSGSGQYFIKGSDTPYTGFLYAEYDNGNPESVQQYMDGIGNGIWIDYDPDGKINCQGTYVNNRVEGAVTFYYEDGSVKSRGQYRHYKRPIGLWTFYDRSGQVVSTRMYTP